MMAQKTEELIENSIRVWWERDVEQLNPFVIFFYGIESSKTN